MNVNEPSRGELQSYLKRSHNEELLEQMLPPEIKSNIFSFLGDSDKQNARMINKEWDVIIVQTAKIQKMNEIKTFIDIAIDKLARLNENLHSPALFSEIEAVKNLKGDIKSFPNIGLLEIKSSLLNHQCQLAKSSAYLDLDELEKTVKDPFPSNNTFKMARAFKQFEEIMNNENVDKKFTKLLVLLDAMVADGNFDTAAEICKLYKSRGDVNFLNYLSSIDYLISLFLEKKHEIDQVKQFCNKHWPKDVIIMTI